MEEPDRVNEQIENYMSDSDINDSRTFESLKVWKKGRRLRNEIEDTTKNFPEEEEWRLKDQIIRSSRSVTANIAEGYGCYYFNENIKYCRKARGSLSETLDHLTVALDRDFMDKNQFDELRKKVLSLKRLLNGYIRYIKNLEKED